MGSQLVKTTEFNQGDPMNIHEYQAKELMKSYGLPTAKGIPCSVCRMMRWQQPSKSAAICGWSKRRFMPGGRGKGGGVKIAKTDG